VVLKVTGADGRGGDGLSRGWWGWGWGRSAVRNQCALRHSMPCASAQHSVTRSSAPVPAWMFGAVVPWHCMQANKGGRTVGRRCKQLGGKNSKLDICLCTVEAVGPARGGGGWGLKACLLLVFLAAKRRSNSSVTLGSRCPGVWNCLPGHQHPSVTDESLRRFATRYTRRRQAFIPPLFRGRCEFCILDPDCLHLLETVWPTLFVCRQCQDTTGPGQPTQLPHTQRVEGLLPLR
jgi:hypothetical protein